MSLGRDETGLSRDDVCNADLRSRKQDEKMKIEIESRHVLMCSTLNHPIVACTRTEPESSLFGLFSCGSESLVVMQMQRRRHVSNVDVFGAPGERTGTSDTWRRRILRTVWISCGAVPDKRSVDVALASK